MLKVSNKNSLFIGDRPLEDIQGAKNVGIKGIWVKQKETEDVQIKPDWIVESISEAGEIMIQMLTEE